MGSYSFRGNLVIVVSFLIALLLSILPLPSWAAVVWPQWLPMVLIYWVIALPHRVSLGTAWFSGLLLDALYGSLLGEHALALTVIAYLADRLHRQVRMFPIIQQALSVLVLIIIYQALLIWVQGMLGLLSNAYWFWLSAFTSMLLWPWIFFLLRSWRRYGFQAEPV